jgi:hypothetical protein
MSKLKSILSETERDERNQLEAVITSGIKTFVEVGTALLTIAEKRLYRETHGSFEPYCQEKWGMSARQAYRLCEAATVVKSLPKNCDQLVTNEAQARELARVPAEKREAVLVKAGTNPTAKAIRQAAAPELKDESTHIEEEKPRVQAGVIDEKFCEALGLPKSSEIQSELQFCINRLKQFEQHLLDADLSGADLIIISKEISELSKRISKVGKARKISESSK